MDRVDEEAVLVGVCGCVHLLSSSKVLICMFNVATGLTAHLFFITCPHVHKSNFEFEIYYTAMII